MTAFEQLNMTEMEMQVLKHAASLTPAQRAENDKRSAPVKREDMPPLQTMFIGPDDVKNLPYMMSGPGGAPAQGGADGPVVNQYYDPFGAKKNIERITVQ